MVVSFNTLAVITGIGYLILLAIGFVVCNKHRWKAGMYFFGLLLTGEIGRWLAGRLIDMGYMDNVPKALNITLGQFVFLISGFFGTIQFAAFLILIISLIRRLPKKPKSVEKGESYE